MKQHVTQGIMLIILTLAAAIIIFLTLNDAVYANVERTVIGCINTNTYHTRVPIATNPESSKCYYGKGWQNIFALPAEQIKYWEDRFTTEQIINRLPIVNFESGFDPKAGNKFAHGYVQTLRKYKVKPDIATQLDWLKRRTSEISPCNKYWEEDNKNDGYKKGEDAVISCIYRHHYSSTAGKNYSKKAMAAREYYKAYYRSLEN